MWVRVDCRSYYSQLQLSAVVVSTPLLAMTEFTGSHSLQGRKHFINVPHIRMTWHAYVPLEAPC